MKNLFIIILILISYLKSSLQTSNVFRFDPIVMIEEPPIGALVLDLAQKLDIKDLATSDYKFRFYSPQSITSHYFLIDQLTGQVKTQRTLDREFLCETKVCGPCTSTSNCSLPIEIVATQTQSGLNIGTNQHHKTQSNKHHLTTQKFVSFDVIIEDKNEFAPKFPNDVIYVNVSEGAPSNFSIPIEPAQDRDSRQTQIRYSLIPLIDESHPDYDKELEKLNSKIRLVIDQSATSQSQLNLIILEPFDYETEKEVKFKILASDGPLNQEQKVLTGSCLVILKIIDINDNLPVFDSNQYEYRLDEDKALAGTRLIRVHATDKDDGLNGLVKYSLVDQTNNQQTLNDISNLFRIDQQTGWISVSSNSNLDYEQMSTYRLIVKAQDSGVANSMPVYTNCIIYLNDVNDNLPLINLTLPTSIDDFNTNLTLNSQNEIELSEWTMPNTFIAQIMVSDRDSGLNGKVKVEINEYRQKTKQTINDYQDENEFSTELDEDTDYNDLVWEESNDFTLVHLFNNIYSLMLKQTLDRELYDRYLINITASDFGQPIQLKTNLNLNIKIQDENDNKPIFIVVANITKIDPITNRVILYEFNISEENNLTDEWIELGRVKAVDYDSGKHGQVTYGLESDKNMFKIDPDQGIVQANKKYLDRELKESYEFNLSVKDNLNKESVKLRINLIDLNDNKPIFEKDLYKFKIFENFKNDEKFIVKAYDMDKLNTEFSEIRYDILDKNEYFRIDHKSGDLIQIKEFDHEKINQIEFRVIAFDNLNKTPSNNSTCLVQFEIIDLNDNYPILNYPKDSDLPLVYSLESLLNDSLITHLDHEENKVLVKFLKLNSTDKDSGLNSKLIFKIEKQVRLRQEKKSYENEDEHLDLFGIDSKTGLIYAKIDLKRKNSISKRNTKLIGSFRLNNSSSKNILSDFNYDQKAIGIYGLVVNISDSNEINPLSKKFFIFFAFQTNSNDQILKSQIFMLKSILNEMKLNSIVNDNLSDYEYEYENESDMFDLNSKDQNQKFNRVLTQFQKSILKLNKKSKQSIQNQISSDSIFSNIKNTPNYLEHVFTKLFNLKTPNNYIILFLLSLFLFILILFACLFLFSIYYKKIRHEKLFNSSAKNHLCDVYTDNFDSSKKTTLNSKTTSSTSPSSSLTSSELLNTNSNRNSTDDDEDDSGGFRNMNQKILKNSKCQKSKDIIREEERAILIVNTSSAASSNNLGSVSSNTNSTKSTNTGSNKINPLIVLVNSTSSSSSSPNDKKLMVASTESLSTTASRSSGLLSSSHKSQTNSFKTFKNSNTNSNTSSPKQIEHGFGSPKQTIILTNEYTNSYRTLPINGYRNLVNSEANNNRKNFDQTNKQLNLPVNELFKRYELKKKATNGVLNNESCSSGSLLSLNSMTLNKKVRKHDIIKRDNVNTFGSPRLAERCFNLNPIINITNNNQNEIPDYFFKDEKEHKMFQAKNKKQILNLKQVVVESTTSKNTD